MSDAHSSLGGFSGSVRLFPLPGLVFFPRVMQPLHVFEPRYRQMTADALDDDRLIAMALPLPGWEEDYDGRPPLHPVCCIGKIATSQRLADGRYNLLLHGLSRARIVAESPSDKLYRVAQVQLLSEVPILCAEERRRWRQRLLAGAPQWFPGPAAEQVRTLCADDTIAPGVLCDMIAFALAQGIEFKQRLLEELDDEARLTALFAQFEADSVTPVVRAKFPPDFSVN
jgi:Lon protease-like protein